MTHVGGTAAARYGVAGAFGSGPVYPMLGSSAAGGCSFAAEASTAVPELRFDDALKAELRIAPGESVRWSGQAPGSRGRPSYIRVAEPGCHAVQIDGTTFSRVVVFRVDISR